MTVETTNSTISYTGNNSVITFSYNFLTYSEDHLFIYLDDVEQTSGFSINGVGDESGGEVIFNTAPGDGVEIRIDRTVPETQLIEYQEYGPFKAKTNERGLDLGVMIAQQNAREIGRDSSKKMDKRTSAPENNVVIFDDEGNSKDSGATIDSINVTATDRVIPFDTLDEAVNETNPLKIFNGAALNLAGRNTKNDGGGAMWDAVGIGTVTPNTFDIVQCVGIPTLALVLRVGDYLPLSSIGCNSTKADNSPEINYAFLNYKTIKVDGDYEIESSVTLSGSGKVVYGLGQGRIWSQQDINLVLLDDAYTNYINNFILENTLTENSSTAILTPPGKYMSNGIIDTMIVRGCAQAFSIEGKDNNFNDFNFTLGALPTQAIVRPSSGRDMKNIISNCTIENTLKSTKLGSGGNPAIFLRGSFNIVYGNRVRNWLGPGILGGDDSIIDSNTVINMADENGIYVSGASRCVVTNNHIENFTADGIAFNGSDHCIASNNYIGGGGNSCVRLQDGCDGINVIGNRMIVDGTHAVRIFMNPGLDAPKNISITNNNIKCNVQAAGNLIAGGATNAGFGKYENIDISHNIVDNYDASLLSGAFFGPYGLVVFDGVTLSESDEISFTDNQVRMADVPSDASGRMATLFGVSTDNNRFVFSGGDIYNGKSKNGQCRFSFGSAGSVDSPNITGLVTSVVKEASAGEYTINTSEVIKIDQFTWNSSGANAPFFIRKNVTAGASSASYGDSFLVTVYNVAGAPVNPNFNAACEMNITRQNERNYI